MYALKIRVEGGEREGRGDAPSLAPSPSFPPRPAAGGGPAVSPHVEPASHVMAPRGRAEPSRAGAGPNRAKPG